MDILYVFPLKLDVPWAVYSAPLHRVVYIRDLTVSEIIGQVVILEPYKEKSLCCCHGRRGTITKL